MFMEYRYRDHYAICEYTEMQAASLMPNIARKTIHLFLEIMGIEVDPKLPVSVSYMAFMDEFLDNGEWILKMIPSVYLDFLLEIWDAIEVHSRTGRSKEIYIDNDGLQMISYLSTFGLLSYRSGSAQTGNPNTIFVVREVMDAFYFQMKSRKTQALIEKYDQWEAMLQGFMRIVGLTQVEEIHKVLDAAMGEKIHYEELIEFMKCRISLWGVGRLLYDQEDSQYYFVTNLVDNSISTYQEIKKCDILKYKQYSAGELISIYESGGGYRKWKGVTDLLSYLVDDLQMEYYRATVLLSKSICDIQNGCTYEHLVSMYDLVTHEMIEKPVQLMQNLETMYYHMPIFSFKGHSHLEYQAEIERIEKNKRRVRFKIVK